MSTYDVVIVGGGMVGASLALMLGSRTSLQVALVDAKSLSADWDAARFDPRVSAISKASQRIFQNLQVWDEMVAKRVSPYRKMHVWDANGDGLVEFDSKQVNTDALGYIVEDSVMRSSILAKLAACGQVECLSPLELKCVHETPDAMEIHAENGTVLKAKLLIAADGGKSWVRDQVEIGLKNWDYEQTAIVTSVETALPHAATAWQRFLPTGPLAFLPLQQANRSSIVWSCHHAESVRLMALNDEEFKAELAEALGHKLGEIHSCEPRSAFPLEMRHAKQYVKPRLALVGDAAHTIHPLAGQGVNLGLLDAACLFDVIDEALHSKRDYASFVTLRRYERWRKGDNAVMLTFVEAIKHVFCSDVIGIKALRNIGLNVTNQLQFMKSYFMNYAAGNRGELPKIAL